MSDAKIELWEPEETIGKIWHGLVDPLDAPEAYGEARITLDQVAPRLAVFFRGLGGDASVEIRPSASEVSHHRLSVRRKLGHSSERVSRASFDGEVLRLPEEISEFPFREANGALYLWLTAAAAHMPKAQLQTDPLRADLLQLRANLRLTQAVLQDCPGLKALYSNLVAALLATRRTRRLPATEGAIETVVLYLLGDPAPVTGLAGEYLSHLHADADLSTITAPHGYRPFMPVACWTDIRALQFFERSKDEEETSDGATGDATLDGVRKANRQDSEQAERRDSLILHKYEAVFSWAEFLNLNRKVEDEDDLDTAKKAADDLDEIGLGKVSKAPATKLKMHLDLSPEDVDRERLSGEHLYPEWDQRTKTYLPDHCRVLSSDAEPGDPAFLHDPKTQRRIHAVKRQFEALRPRHIIRNAQISGDDLDIEAVVRAQIDLAATGQGSDRVWRDSRNEARDLAVSILLDISRSTESAVGERAVIDIEREALTALAWGLDTCGDDCAIHAFSSLRRDRVNLHRCKTFAEPMSHSIEARIAGLRPAFYTRLGAAIRHVSTDLAKQSRQRRLLLVITDGKPNDLDHYEGQHGIEDSRMAINEARRSGQAVFGITIDKKAQNWFPRIFGRGGFALVADPDKLTTALPAIYRQLVTG